MLSSQLLEIFDCAVFERVCSIELVSPAAPMPALEKEVDPATESCIGAGLPGRSSAGHSSRLTRTRQSRKARWCCVSGSPLKFFDRGHSETSVQLSLASFTDNRRRDLSMH